MTEHFDPHLEKKASRANSGKMPTPPPLMSPTPATLSSERLPDDSLSLTHQSLGRQIVDLITSGQRDDAVLAQLVSYFEMSTYAPSKCPPKTALCDALATFFPRSGAVQAFCSLLGGATIETRELLCGWLTRRTDIPQEIDDTLLRSLEHRRTGRSFFVTLNALRGRLTPGSANLNALFNLTLRRDDAHVSRALVSAFLNDQEQAPFEPRIEALARKCAHRDRAPSAEILHYLARFPIPENVAALIAATRNRGNIETDPSIRILREIGTVQTVAALHRDLRRHPADDVSPLLFPVLGFARAVRRAAHGIREVFRPDEGRDLRQLINDSRSIMPMDLVEITFRALAKSQSEIAARYLVESMEHLSKGRDGSAFAENRMMAIADALGESHLLISVKALIKIIEREPQSSLKSTAEKALARINRRHSGLDELLQTRLDPATNVIAAAARGRLTMSDDFFDRLFRKYYPRLTESFRYLSWGAHMQCCGGDFTICADYRIGSGTLGFTLKLTKTSTTLFWAFHINGWNQFFLGEQWAL